MNEWGAKLPEHIKNHINKSGPNGCWIWTGVLNTKGYGIVYFDGRSRMVHRVIYENLIGSIPEDKEIDHLCRKVSTEELALNSIMPWNADIARAYYEGRDVPPSANMLLSYQRADFYTIGRRFVAAGIKVTDPKGLLGNGKNTFSKHTDNPGSSG